MALQATLLEGLGELVRETYHCWEEGWVGFTWQNYTYDHVQRVRKLAVVLGQAEQVDLEVLDVAALLHDITKGYDGEIFTDPEGKRILDEHGFWRNELRPPISRNRVTELYDQLSLAGQLHHESGAVIARRLLTERGMAPTFCERVGGVIRAHLRPNDDSPAEGLVLYDADTIDANCGLPAFLRNIHIHLHFRETRAEPGTLALDTLLRECPQDYLEPYIREQLPSWAAGKRRDFVPRLTTSAGREMAQARLTRLEQTLEDLANELDDFHANSQRGRLAVMLYFMRHRQNPVLSDQLDYLEDGWLGLTEASPDARALITAMRSEMQGVA